MKRLLVVVLFGLAGLAQANPYHDGRFRYHDHGHRSNWVAPLIIGGVVGYALARPQQPVYQPPPVYQNTVPPAPYGYHYEQIVDGNCNCYRWVIVPN